MNADALLSRLDGVRRTGEGRWISRCPAHEDKSPSLSIRQTGDGRLLIHDFGGCSTQLVLQAMGLDFGDLFPEKPLAHHLPPVRGGFTARELLELHAHEAIVAADLATRAMTASLTPDEAQRLVTAAGRLTHAAGLVHGR